jgi:hypothetical protein
MRGVGAHEKWDDGEAFLPHENNATAVVHVDEDCDDQRGMGQGTQPYRRTPETLGAHHLEQKRPLACGCSDST